MEEYNTLSLFSGAGGLDLGFKQQGFNIIAANEMDKNAGKTHERNFKETELIKGDIDTVFEEILKFKNTDIIIGGPPCQGFSIAGKMDYNDPRNKMVWKYLEVVKELKPRIFVIENVKALYSLDKWRPIREKIISDAYDMGYSCLPILLNAKDFGVSQSRYRVFFIGVKDSELDKDSILAYIDSLKEQPKTVRELFKTVDRIGMEGNPIDSTAKITFATNPILRKSPYAGMLFNGMGRPVNIDGIANTLPASMGGNKTPIIDNEALYNNKINYVEEYHSALMRQEKSKNGEAPSRLRRLSIKEAALIQSFPEDFKFEGPMSSVYRQIGNAVPPKLASVIGELVKAILEDRIEKSTFKIGQLNLFS
ncbi:DNA cytosine methyltransferase [Latilactobacillus sakei]|uniref:Cytosine-specific methyltransferase n=1 Tax=Latilactobacillus sakei TaxID=1599 RepID=A0AAF0K4Y2_LATSK|nr:DNA cytosine methyltransferase [Latilactobacillus sakei]WGI19248.1 DNA cytosine methyltransferase [Latilactobacillus sakei]